MLTAGEIVHTQRLAQAPRAAPLLELRIAAEQRVPRGGAITVQVMDFHGAARDRLQSQLGVAAGLPGQRREKAVLRCAG